MAVPADPPARLRCPALRWRSSAARMRACVAACVCTYLPTYPHIRTCTRDGHVVRIVGPRTAGRGSGAEGWGRGWVGGKLRCE